MERKFLNFVFREAKVADEEKGIVEGYAAVFNNMDQGFDIIEEGAFRKTLKENKGKVPILSNHMWTKQIGWNLEATEDMNGLKVRGQFDIETNACAREHFSLIKMGLSIGVKPGFSFGYRTIKSEPDMSNPSIRRLKELKLLEWSPVTFPMNLEAGATNAKAGLQILKSEIEFFLSDLQSRGYSHSEIDQALKRAANPEEDPSPDAGTQSLLETIKNLRQTITR